MKWKRSTKRSLKVIRGKKGQTLEEGISVRGRSGFVVTESMHSPIFFSPLNEIIHADILESFSGRLKV